MRCENLKLWTMKFKDPIKEKQFCDRREDMFRSSMWCVFVIWIFIVMCQAIMNANCIALLLSLCVSSIVLVMGFVLVMAEELICLPEFLKKSSSKLMRNRITRTIFVCSIIVLMSTMSILELFVCPIDLPTTDDTFNGTILDGGNSKDVEKPLSSELINRMQETCLHPEYSIFTWVLCLVALASVLTLYYIVKISLALLMSIFIMALVSTNKYFQYSEKFKYDEETHKTTSSVPVVAQMLILIFVFFVMVAYHAKLVELTSRLDFIWKERAEHELSKMKLNRSISNNLVEVNL